MPTRRKGASSVHPISNRVNEVAGLILIAVAVFSALALWSFHPGDPSWSHRVSAGWSVRNYGGWVGAYIAGEFVQLMGAFAMFIPLAVFAWGVRTFTGLRSLWPGWQGLGGLMIALSGAGLFYKAFQIDPLFGKSTLAGGLVGYGMAIILETYLGRLGSWVVLMGALLAAVVATTGLSIGQVLYYLSRGPRWMLVNLLPRLWAAGYTGAHRLVNFVWDSVKDSIKASRLKKAAKEARKSATFWKEFRESWSRPDISPSGGGEAASGLAADDGAVSLAGAVSPAEEPNGAKPRLNPVNGKNGISGDSGEKSIPSGEVDEKLRGGPSFGPSRASGQVLFMGPAAEAEGKSAPKNRTGSPEAGGPEAGGSETGDSKARGPKVLFGPALDDADEQSYPEEPAPRGSGEGGGDEAGVPETVSEAAGPDGRDEETRPEKVRLAEVLSSEEEPDTDKSALRIGRKENPEEREAQRAQRVERVERAERVENETPMSIPSLENDSDPEEMSLSLKRALSGSGSQAENGDTQAENGDTGVKVRHAGADGETGIVRIEDDALVSDGAPASKKAASRKNGHYVLPKLDLFAEAESSALIVDEEAIREKSTLLEQTLREFGVEGEITEVKTGPVITIYEFAPAPGVKVSKIASLSDDLARSLAAISVRIVAPIPGTNVVGIEVPNLKRRAVRVKELLASREFGRAKEKLTLGLGKDILGRTAITDLAKIPHLLIAGSTGSGKSVAMNMMISSLLVRCHPREVRFLMIDPKMLEFSIYEGIPHLLVPVVTDPKRAASALRGVVAEMERRYQLMSELGVRNIESYNNLVTEFLGPREARRRRSQHLDEAEYVRDKGNPDFMPYIVVVIDELADLMMVSSREVEETMTRLAQMARAAGIHLLVATQRPSVDVLTGLIKANFPSRIALRVASRVDSRTILDMNGAERLLGKGDMLFVPPGTSAPVRIHGAFVSDKEIKNLVEYWKAQGPTAFQDDLFVQAESKESAGAEEQDYDERYDDAVALVARTGEASISLIQRHLRIGYNRAARLIERMEVEGVVGPSEGAKRRQVLIQEIPGAEVESIDAV